MIVEEKLGSGDRFPMGMRVLAVDDDRTCLKLLEGLLRRCRYNVTTTNQAIVALKLLRENKDKFDLVISDVHMPDMDGFKLLELVGLEMDLPVIMLSANSDPKAVMKGITHGACDYLLKPVRLEELKNIWQHVVRKKFDPKELSGYDHGEEADKPNRTNSEGGNDPVPSGSSDRNGRTGKKRKDQNEDDEDFEEDGNDNDDPSAQKKPRVVWSVELHRKFVAAVNQLGIDKAMPKRILDLMNVEKLTRENVASHLQKYRLYLKRIASQQANVVAAFGGRDSSYLHMGSLDGMRNYHTFAGSRPIPAITFQQGGMVGRLNSPTGSGLYNLASSGALQLGHTNNSSNSMHDQGKLPNISFSGASRGNLLQGMPTSLDINQLQQNKNMLDSHNPMLSTLSSAKFPTGGYDSSFLNSVDNTQTTNQQKPSNLYGNRSSATLASLSTDPFEMSSGIPSFVPDNRGRCNGNWPANSLPLSMTYSHEALPTGNLRDNSGSSLVSSVDSNLRNISSNNAAMSSYPDGVMGREFHCQDGNMLVLPTSTNDEMGYGDIGSLGGSKSRWENQTQRPNLMYNSPSNPVISMDSLVQSAGFSTGVSNKRSDMAMMNRSNFSSPMYMQNCDFERSIPGNQLKYKEDSTLNSTKLQGLCNTNGYDSFDDLMSVVKREREDILMDEEIGCDLYSLETCI